MTTDPDRRDEGDTPLDELMRRLMSGQFTPADLEEVRSELASTFGMSLPPEMLAQAMSQVQQMMSGPDEGPVQWSLAQDTARKVAASPDDEGRPDAVVSDSARRSTVEALRTASMWLDAVTTVPPAALPERAWSRAEWVEATLPTWQSLCTPVAEQVSSSLSGIVAGQLPDQFAAMAAQADTMMRKMGGAVFGAQVGRAVGGLSAQVVSGHDIGLPLVTDGSIALLPANVTDFGAGLEVPEQEVLLYLALREVAYARLFAHAGWLRARVLSAVTEFARGITVDTAGLEEAVRSIDPTDPQALQQAMASGMFEPQRTPAQQAVLTRLETTLALVEGWVDEVTNAAAVKTLPEAARLREAVRRRRAVGGPAEHTLTTLVGLELRPRRLREAAALWAATALRHGEQARDEVWDHPDLMPTTQDLDDPLGYAERYRTSPDSDLDAELRDLLDGK
jgi:putative hydrolase